MKIIGFINKAQNYIIDTRKTRKKSPDM